ncbi:MAG: DUF1778 domain-containing protein [Alphaproteobacteria bacterium]|nr:DUF1778 domain-containing protein [Alphaproteobacteria bacterium]
MPRAVVKDNYRFAMRISPEKKSRLARAAAIQNTDLTEFMLRNALSAADVVIDKAEHIMLTEKQTRFWMDLLENPPKPNARLIATAKALPDDR